MIEKPYHHGDLRNTLIETGINLINEKGLKGFSLRKVATACNVSHTAPYSHFQNIDELIHAMGEYVSLKFSEKLRNSILGHENSPEAVSLLGQAYISFFADNPQYFQFLFYHSGVIIDLDSNNEDDYPPFAIFRSAGYEMFRSLGLPEELFKEKLIVLWSMVHGIASLMTNPGIKYSDDWCKVFTNNISDRRQDT